ncbi:MAG: alpha/beta hydrolase [Clostridia bacterium]|nr:alpha/beta hydrolase [Clostridia bacterium]
MKKSISTNLVSITLVFMLLIAITSSAFAADTPLSDYDLYYRQFVDSQEPLQKLMDDDMVAWGISDTITHPNFSVMPDENRVDYFDIAYGSDPMQKLDIHHAKGNKLRPVIFFIHGGGWVMGDKDHSRYAGPTWVKLGYTVVSINYRLAPQNPAPAQIEDTAMALKWVIDNIKDYGGDPNRIAVTGHSSGGHLTAQLVTDTKWHEKFGIDIKKVKCWIPNAGIYDFNLPENGYHSWMQWFLGDLFKFVPDVATSKTVESPINYVTGKEAPCLIVHGADDWLVPRSNAYLLYDKIKEKGGKVEMEIIPGYWHCNTITTYGDPGDKPTEVINKYLARHLPTAENNLGDYNGKSKNK